MAEILYPKYRKFIEKRVETNNAVIALLAGSQLALHTLQLTEGSSATLKNVFPAVNHIKRFDLKTSDAKNLLSDVEHHLSSVAVPYALATHEAYVTDLLEDLKNWGYTIPSTINSAKMHEAVFDALQEPYPQDLLETFHVLRLVRNEIIHNQGIARSTLKGKISDLSSSSISTWEKRNLGNSPQMLINPDDTLNLTAETIFTAFALSKELGRAINKALENNLPTTIWAKIVVSDYGSNSTRAKNTSQWKKGLKGLIRQQYKNLYITKTELEQEARAQGFWTSRISF